jgi:CBS domain-containing protein
MSKPSAAPADNAPIPIRRRSVLCGDGTTRASGYVACPRARASTSLRHCLTCPRFQGFRGSEVAPASHIACEHGAAAVDDAELVRPSDEHARDPEQTPVSSIMTRDVICVDRTVSIEALTALFVERDINAVPVVDETGEPIGIVSKADVIREHYALADPELPPEQSSKHWDYDCGPAPHVESLRGARVVDIMMPLVFTLREEATIARAAALMALKSVHQLPIASAAGEIVGIVSSLDILRWLAGNRDDWCFSSGRRA